MRTLRNRTVGILAVLAVLAWAGTASASTISYTWLSTSGAGQGVGTPTLTGLAPSDTAVLAITVTVATGGQGISYVGAGATYNGSVVTGAAIEMCPADATNPFAPSCGGFATAIGGAGGFMNALPPTTLNGAGGLGQTSWGQVGAGAAGSGQANGAVFTLAHITFHAVGPGTTGGFWSQPAFSGEGTIGSPLLNPIANPEGFSVQVIPEPGTIALLALGLGTLAFAGRRR